MTVFSNFTPLIPVEQALEPLLKSCHSSDEDVSDQVSKKEYLEIHHQAVCPHSGYPDRLWTEKNLVDLKSEPKVNACQKICSQVIWSGRS